MDTRQNHSGMTEEILLVGQVYNCIKHIECVDNPCIILKTHFNHRLL